MYGDFSRLTFDRANGYTAVWSQQGRMQLDADLNEQTAILLDWMRTMARDFIGPAGGHIQRAGFEVSVDPDSGDLILGPGHYYVDGIRCHVPPPGWGGGPVTYRALQQPYDPAPPDMPYLVYLRVWEGSVNHWLHPTLLEPALGPACPDTTIRSQVAWSLAFTTPPTVAQPSDLTGAVADQFAAMNDPVRPLLQARLSAGGSSDGPEEAATISGYSGPENQLYRFEIQCGSGDLDQPPKFDPKKPPTVKWSRDNGSVEFGFQADTVTQDKTTSTLILTGAALPGRPTLNKGDCVEVIDDSWRPFDSPPYPLLEVTDVDPAAHTVTVGGLVEASAAAKTALLRRWDSAPGDGDGIPVELSNSPEDGWITIENGIEIRFPATEGARFQRGDYWLVPARAATARIYGPTTDQPDGARPYGPERRYAPLALVESDNVQPTDLRTLFTHLAWPDAHGGSS